MRESNKTRRTRDKHEERVLELLNAVFRLCRCGQRLLLPVLAHIVCPVFVVSAMIVASH